MDMLHLGFHIMRLIKKLVSLILYAGRGGKQVIYTWL